MTTLTREQWDAKRDAFIAFTEGAANTLSVDHVMLLHFGPRPDDAPSVEWTDGGIKRTATFVNGGYRVAPNDARCVDVVSVADNHQVDCDNTLFALLALNPDGPVARLQRERDTWRANYMHVADAICRESKGVDDLVAQARTIREEHDTLQARVTELEDSNSELAAHVAHLRGNAVYDDLKAATAELDALKGQEPCGCDPDVMPHEWVEYIRREMPVNTIIGKPEWWAPRLWRSAMHYARNRRPVGVRDDA